MLIKRLAFKFGIICSLIKNALEEKKIVNYVTNDLHRKSSLFYNNSARHWQHECDTSNMSDTSDTSSTRVKNFDFDNDANKNIFSRPYISYMANQRSQWEEQFLSFEELLFRNVSFPCQNVFEKCTTKLNFTMPKSISKSHTLDCNCKWTCTFLDSNTVLFSVKIVLCETIITFF